MLTTRVSGSSSPIHVRRLTRRPSCSSRSRRRGRRTCRRPPAARARRSRGAAAVAVALEAPAAPDERRRDVRVQLGRTARASRPAIAGDLGGALEGPLGRRARAAARHPSRAGFEEGRRRRARSRTGGGGGRAPPAGRCRASPARAGRPAGRAASRADRSPRASRLGCCASWMNGTRWMPDVDGLAPQMTIRRRVHVVLVRRPTASCRRAPSAAAPVGAAHTVRARREAPRRRNSRASIVSCVSSPFEPPYEKGRIDSPPHVSRRLQRLGDALDRLVPGRCARRRRMPFGPIRTAGTQQPIGAVDALAKRRTFAQM